MHIFRVFLVKLLIKIYSVIIIILLMINLQERSFLLLNRLIKSMPSVNIFILIFLSFCPYTAAIDKFSSDFTKDICHGMIFPSTYISIGNKFGQLNH